MEIPSKVMIHNQILGVKGQVGTLISVSEAGFYEIHMQLGGATHKILFPVAETILIFADANQELVQIEVER